MGLKKTRCLAQLLDSLVRVSRRVKERENWEWEGLVKVRRGCLWKSYCKQWPKHKHTDFSPYMNPQDALHPSVKILASDRVRRIQRLTSTPILHSIILTHSPREKWNTWKGKNFQHMPRHLSPSQIPIILTLTLVPLFTIALPPFHSLSTTSSPFDSLFKVLFIFPSRYLFAIGVLHCI